MLLDLYSRCPCDRRGVVSDPIDFGFFCRPWRSVPLLQFPFPCLGDFLLIISPCLPFFRGYCSTAPNFGCLNCVVGLILLILLVKSRKTQILVSHRHLLGELWVRRSKTMAGGLLAGELCPGSTQLQWIRHAPMPRDYGVWYLRATRVAIQESKNYVLKAKKTSKLPFEQRIGLWLSLLKNKKRSCFLWLGLFPCCFFFCEETWHLRPAQRGFSFYAWGREKPERPQSKTCPE